MHNVIKGFLLERKNSKIKEKIKPNLDESEKQKILDDLEKQFSLEVWLPDAAKRATWLTMVSHPSKFSHPDAKTSSIISNNKKANDGYLRSGNVEYGLDVFGNAAALDVYKFLNLKMSDGNTILNHLERDSEEIKSIFTIPTANYEDLKQGFISIKQSDNSNKTDRLVKQVYFPTKNSYNLLSILTPSGLITEIKDRIDQIRFSEETKEAKDFRKENKYHQTGYNDILELTVVGYGGTKPQNISILNNKNGGRSYLLPSLPPKIEKRNIRFPNYDFFTNSLWIKSFKDDFKYLNKIIHDNRNNIKIRDFRAELIKSIIDKVLESVLKIRDVGGDGWSNSENYKNLSMSQKIWLDNFYLKDRQEKEDWIEEISGQFARWIIRTYEDLFKEKAEMLSDEEHRYIKEEARETILMTRSFS